MGYPISRETGNGDTESEPCRDHDGCSGKKEKSTHFKGILVSGMMATKTMMQTESARGYALDARMLDVISSPTSLPNMRTPATAMARSSRSYTSHSSVGTSFRAGALSRTSGPSGRPTVKMYVTRNPLRNFVGCRMSR